MYRNKRVPVQMHNLVYVKSSGVCNRHDMPNFASLGKGDTGVSCMIGILLLSICKTHCLSFGASWTFGFDSW